MYTFLKLLHIAAVVVFLGNIFTGLFWHAHAAQTRDPLLLAHAMRGIIRSDRWFTVPGVVVMVATGLTLAIVGHLPILRTGWIMWSIVAISISGVIFAVRVAPLQRSLLAMTTTSPPENFNYKSYRRLTIRWEIWGGIALLTPMAALALMVLKPVA